MPRRHYSEGQIQDCLDLYKSLELTGHHRRHGVKDHMTNILKYSYPYVYRRDINNILDILKERGVVGEHHVIEHLESSKEAGRGFHAAMAKDRLMNNIRSFKGQKSITPGVHKILAIPDSHASVALNNERFAWAGRLAADRKPEYVVQIGDWCSWDCFSGHEKAGTVKYAKKPNFETEFAVFSDSVKQFNDQLPKKYNPKKHVTYGNHEERIYIYEDNNPAISATLSHRVEQVYEGSGWSWSPYGARHYVEGVIFTHKPFNAMGKPKSMTALKRDLSCDIYTGHDHKKLDEKVPKDDDEYTMISGGCFMPDGYEPRYAANSTNGWWYGCQILTVENGKIRDTEWISVRTLEKLYG